MRSIPVSFSSAFPIVLTLFACLCWVTLPFALGQEASPLTTPAPLITQPVDESQLTTLKGNVYPLARPEFDLGTAPASLPMERMLLVLKRSPEQEFALRTMLDDQQDKASPSYHTWLTPERFGQQFGPNDSDLQIITAWLESHGFQVGTTTGRTVLEFSGSASQVQEAFHTTIHKYLVNGEQHWANSSDPMIPTALTPAVAGIDSLHNFQRRATNRYVGVYSEKTKRLDSSRPSNILGSFTVGCGSGQTCYAVSPYDFATIYDLLPLWNATSPINGTGQTIAIVGRTNINASDPTTFWSLFGLTVPANKLNIILNGTDPGINGDEGEADIDIQWSGAVAPQATIDFVTSQSTETTDGVDLSAVYIVENNLAPVMSESYGECELGLGTAGNQFYYALWEQAAAQGISVFVSSGDNGSAGCDDPGAPAQYGLNVNGLASTPFDAAIGGTDFNQYNTQTRYWNTTNGQNQESAKAYIPEVAWNDSCSNPWALTAGLGSTSEQVCNNPDLNPFFLNSTGGSGGPSNCVVNTQGVIGSCTQKYPKPSWQKGNGVPVDSARDLPDASLFASNGILTASFYVICQSDQTGGVCNLNALAGYGGTSVASPAFAGIMSLVNQKTSSPQGVPGFALYQLATTQSNAFHDVPSGTTIAMPCVTGSPNCTTNTAGDSYGVLSGYSTGTGYDLATGLGSVDAANLVDNWSKATFTPTTTALTLNKNVAVNITHGQSVPVAIDVSPTAATGAASLLVSNSTGTTIGQAIDGFALTNGATSSTAATSMLPAGTNYYVIAHYGGDGTYGGSYSSPVAVTVSKENSTVILKGVIVNGSASPVTSFPFDAQYYGRADVGNSQGALCSPPPFGEVACPSGSVIFTVDGTQQNLNSFELNSEGYTETQVGALGVLTGGQHTIGAQYSGDNNYNAGSGSVVVTVTRAATETTQVTAQGAITQPVALTTDIEDPTAYYGLSTIPTGTVTFYLNGTAIPGTPTYGIGDNGITLYTTATLTTTFSAPGTYTLTANYSGDQNYQPSASTASQVTLQYPTPTVSATPATQYVLPGTPVTLTVVVDTTNKLQPPTGTVTLGNGNIGLPGPATCTQTTDSSGNYACQATFTFTPPPPSESTVDFFSAQYSGDTNYPTSQSGTVWIYITDFSLSPGSGTVTVPQGQSQTVAINVSPLNGFSGAVSNFSCTGLPAETTCGFNPATVTGGSGSTTLTITTTPLGQMRRRAANETHNTGWMASAMFILLGICLIGVPLRRRPRATMAALMILTVALLPSCGGGGTPPPPPNPVPSISSLSPTQQAAGSQSQTLTINGTGFISSSTVTYNGAAHTATYMSGTQLTINLTTADMASTGSFPVVVTNPAPGGGASSPVNFDVVTGTPTGSFTVTVTATSGPLQHSTTFNLTVQ